MAGKNYHSCFCHQARITNLITNETSYEFRLPICFCHCSTYMNHIHSSSNLEGRKKNRLTYLEKAEIDQDLEAAEIYQDEAAEIDQDLEEEIDQDLEAEIDQDLEAEIDQDLEEADVDLEDEEPIVLITSSNWCD